LNARSTNLNTSIRQSSSFLFTMNDWLMSTFLWVIIVSVVIVWESIIIDNFVIPLPIVRQVIVFIFFTFIPGFLVMRCLKLHLLGTIPSLLYAVGLSLLVLMFTGFCVNFLYPTLGISNPISLYPLLVTMSLVVGVLSMIAYKIDGTWLIEIPHHFQLSLFKRIREITDRFSNTTLLLLILPFLAILGTFFVNFNHNTSILWILLTLVAIIVLLVGFDVIPAQEYPLVIYIIGLSLLFHTSLISMYITGSDIHQEYYFANLVLESSVWNPAIASNVNAMLSIVMLAPIYSLFLNLETGWVFKIVYPFLFSLLPLGMYQLFRTQLGDKFGCISTLFLFSVASYFTLMLHVLRQEIAELFLILLLLLLVDYTIERKKKEVLALVFASGIVVSHYGLAWIYIIIFSLTFLFLFLQNFLFKTGKLFQDHSKTIGLENSASKEEYENRLISAKFVILYVIINIIWYFLITGSTLITDFYYQYKRISVTFSSSFFQIQQSQPAAVLKGGVTTPIHLLSKSLNIIPLMLIGIGILITVHWLLTNCKAYEYNLKKEFAVISVFNFILLAGGFVIPGLFMFSSVRVYHIVLIVLAPFTIIGGIQLTKKIANLIKLKKIPSKNTFLKVFSIFFTLLLLFETGVIYEVTNDHPVSKSISQAKISQTDYLSDINQFYAEYYLEPELFSARWIFENYNSTKIVYGDHPSIFMPLMSYGRISNGTQIKKGSILNENSYIYLRFFNVHYGMLSDLDIPPPSYWNISEFSQDFTNRSTIYNNSFSKVLY
jgi:uncharacterized membrane protein